MIVILLLEEPTLMLASQKLCPLCIAAAAHVPVLSGGGASIFFHQVVKGRNQISELALARVVAVAEGLWLEQVGA
jgi:hypothetical protein